jgi:hypothetical protein
MNKLFEILVPTMYGDTVKPISTKHHKEWDKVVRSLSGGLTILKVGKGQWIYQNNLFEERVIPVRIFTDDKTMKKIIDFSFQHYRQIAIMYYVVSTECYIVDNPKLKK